MIQIKSIAFSESDQRKFELYQFLFFQKSGSYSINFICKSLDYSYKNVLSLLELINHDLQKYFNLDGIYKNNQLHLFYQLPDPLIYKEKLLKNSFCFKSLLAIVTPEKVRLSDLAAESFISIATATRSLLPLKKYFTSYDIHFKMSDLTLSGDERIIRLSLIELFWQFSKGQYLPRPKENDPLWSEYLIFKEKFICRNTSFLSVQKIQFCLVIFFLRTVNKHPVTEDVPEIFEHFITQTKRKILPDYQFKQIGKQEELFLLLVPYFPFIELSEKNKQHIYLKQFALNEGKVYANFTKEFLEHYLQLTGNLSKRNKLLLEKNIFSITLFFSLLQRNIPTFFDLVDIDRLETNPDYLFLKGELSLFLKKYFRRKKFNHLSPLLNSFLDVTLLSLLPDFLARKKRRPLTVYLIVEINALFLNPLISFLEGIPFIHLVNSSLITEPPESYDLILTSSSDLIDENLSTPYYVIKNYYYEAEFTDLYLFLTALYQKKQTEPLIFIPSVTENPPLFSVEN